MGMPSPSITLTDPGWVMSSYSRTISRLSKWVMTLLKPKIACIIE